MAFKSARCVFVGVHHSAFVFETGQSARQFATDVRQSPPARQSSWQSFAYLVALIV